MKKTKKILIAILIFVLLIQMFIFTICITASAVSFYAESFDRTKIKDDLAGVNLENYPKNPMGDLDIISFVEYSYSNQSHLSEYFGLYIYVYNPTAKPIAITNGNNSVNAVVGFDENGNGIFENVNLEYLDKTSDELIYKFKLSRATDFLKMAREYAIEHEGKRVYEIIDIQVKHGKDTAHADVSKKYEWSGFAAYCNDDSSAISTLECTDFSARSIHLNLLQTNYRFAPKSGEGTLYDNIRDELNSVFFTIPNEYFEDFGNLYKVKAEWYEYKTAPIYVTSSAEAYSALWNMRNIRINEFGKKIDENGNIIDESIQSYWRVFFDFYVYKNVNTDTYKTYIGQTYNGKVIDDIDSKYKDFITFGMYNNNGSSWCVENCLNWIFYASDTTSANRYMISKDEVKDYMVDYSNRFSDQDLIRNKYAAGLFTDSIDVDRLQFLDLNRKKDENGNYILWEDGTPQWNENVYNGLVKMEFTAGENFDLGVGNQFIDSDKSQTAWNKFWYGTDYETVTYSPIVVVNEGDLYLSPEVFSEKYYVNLQDVSEILAESRRAYSKGEHPVLLRFAVTDYYSSEAFFDYAGDDDLNMVSRYGDIYGNGYVAQETCFLDFDVLSLTFQNAEGYNEVAIGVVAVPIDIINGLTPPQSLVEDEEWWQKLVALIMLVIILLILFFVIDKFLPWLGNLIKLFFKGLGWILNQLWRFLTWPLRAVGKKIKVNKKKRAAQNSSKKKKSSGSGSKSKSKKGVNYGKQKTKKNK